MKCTVTSLTMEGTLQVDTHYATVCPTLALLWFSCKSLILLQVSTQNRSAIRAASASFDSYQMFGRGAAGNA